MEFYVDKTDGDTLFRLVLGLVVPRPIGWVSTVSREGITNIAPFSFFNAVNDEPPVLMISVSDRDEGSLKDTVRNILDTGEFVVNLVSEELFEKMLITGEDFPPQVSEFEKAGLTPQKSKTVKAPRIGESKASFECKLYKHIKVYDMHLILGEVRLIRVEEGIADEEGRIDYERLKVIGRMGGSYYLRCFGESLIRVNS
jgi:flavin reductase (DIM6/NTAB) family NADH-FMN oxidoreductase RutF